MSKFKEVLIITLSDEINCQTKSKHLKNVSEAQLTGTKIFYSRPKDFARIKDELRKRSDVILFDGRIADEKFKEWDFKDICDAISVYDMPTELFSFIEPPRVKLPGVMFIAEPIEDWFNKYVYASS